MKISRTYFDDLPLGTRIKVSDPLENSSNPELFDEFYVKVDYPDFEWEQEKVVYYMADNKSNDDIWEVIDKVSFIDPEINSMQRDVEIFMLACDQKVASFPHLPHRDVMELRIKLMIEELTGPGELIESMRAGDLTGVADGLSDLLYVVFGTAAAYGINVQQVFNEVHRSNMTKVLEDGTVLRREDGKVLKPETFSPADIMPVIAKQINDAQTYPSLYKNDLSYGIEENDDDN